MKFNPTIPEDVGPLDLLPPGFTLKRLMDVLGGVGAEAMDYKLTINNTQKMIDTQKKEKNNMAEIIVLANYNPNTGSETLLGFFEDEQAVQDALKDVVSFRIDGSEVKVARDFNYRVHRFKTNVRIVTEKLPQPQYDHGDVHTYFTVLSSNKMDTYGIAVDGNGMVQGCTCLSWEKQNYGGVGCKHMDDLQRELNTAAGRKKIGWDFK